ncbi:MAG: hypothetical protein ABFD76_05270 [Smithella sp.]
MSNRKVTKDVSDPMISAAVLALFWGEKTQRLIEANATDHTKVTVNKAGYYIPLLIGDSFFLIDTATHVSSVDDLDTGAVEAGKDYYVYACDNAGTLVFKISLASTYPAGYDATTSRKLGGFHTLCAAVGPISGHTLTGYAQKNILPASIWDLKHRAKCGNNAGMAFDSLSRIWVDIYLASGTGANTVSVNGGTISDNRVWNDFVDDGGAVGKRLLSDPEFQLCMEGSNQKTNIVGSSDPVTTGGHSDTAGRRMISNIGLEDGCGVMHQWLLDQSYRWDSDGTMAAASKTAAITHDAAPGGNPIYLKFGPGTPYLCCNMATDAADKWITFGNAVTVMVRHDADAATGGFQVYFDEDASQPNRLLCALPGLKDVYMESSDPNYPLKITYNAAPGTPGVAINYDDGADQRLEFTSPTAANGTLDLASYSLTWAYRDAGGNKGSVYRQSTYGDVKLLAGGCWYNGTSCGSRSRFASSYRWSASTNFGARFASEPL